MSWKKRTWTQTCASTVSVTWRMVASSLEAGRHQRKRIMCNYNRQSKTKPFTFNELPLEIGRLPQRGILMKQMVDCSQGNIRTVLLFFVFCFFSLQSDICGSLRSLTCLLTASCVQLLHCVCMDSIYCILYIKSTHPFSNLYKT